MTRWWGTKRALLAPLGVWTYRDVLLSVLADDAWTAFARRLSRGLIAEELAAREGIEPDPERVRAAAEAHRRSERLLTVEELESWLASQDLSVHDWHHFIVRGVLSAQLAERLDGDERDLSGTERFGEAFFAEALCSVYLPRARDAFTERLALAAEAGPLQLAPAPDAPAILARYPWLREVSEDRVSHVRAVQAAAQTRLALVTTDLRVRAVLEQRRLDWTRLVCEVFLVPDRQVAREIAQCLRHEGPRFLDRAGHLPDLGRHVREFLLEEAPGELRTHLIGAAAGAVAGPFAEADHHTVYWICDRRPPRDDDPGSWARAVATIHHTVLRTAAALGVRAEDRPFHG